MSELKPCPFCGFDVAKSPLGHIWCDQCDYRLETDRYNTRPIEDALLTRAEAAEAEVKRLRNALAEFASTENWFDDEWASEIIESGREFAREILSEKGGE